MLQHQSNLGCSRKHMGTDFLFRANQMACLQMFHQFRKPIPFHDNAKGTVYLSRLKVAGALGKTPTLETALGGGNFIMSTFTRFKIPLHATIQAKGKLKDSTFGIFFTQFCLPVECHLRVEQKQPWRQFLRIYTLACTLSASSRAFFGQCGCFFPDTL